MSDHIQTYSDLAQNNTLLFSSFMLIFSENIMVAVLLMLITLFC